MRFLFLLFVIVPLIEIILLINVGQLIGAWYTIGLVLLSAFIGVNMLRRQGLSTLMRARSRMDGGEIPAQEMIEGIILAVGGALLITPGFVTDFFGFCCLIPATRRALVRQLQQNFSVVSAHQGHTVYGHKKADDGFEEMEAKSRARSQQQSSSERNHKPGTTIDGEFHRDD